MMNLRNQTLVLPVVATVGAIAAVAPVSAGSGEPSWTIHKPSNTGVPGDTTLDIFVDPNGKPWIPGYITFWEEGGMARWDQETDTWFVVSNVDYPVIASPRFNDIDADASGIMWIGTEAGLLRYDPAVGPASLVRFDEFNTPMPGDQVSQVSIAPDGSVWLAIHNHGEVPPGGLARYDPAGHTWDVWTTANGLPWGHAWPGWDWIDYAAAAPDDDGGYTVYFGSTEMGAASYKDGVFRWFQEEPSVPVIWSVASDDPVDDVGHLWLSTDQGLARRDPDGSVNVVGSPVSGSVEAFSGGRAGLRAFNGDVWVYDNGWSYRGNWGGGSTYALAEGSPGVLWAGGSGGAARYENGFWQRYRVTNTGMLSYFIETIDFDNAGNAYVNGNAAAGVGGFDIFDGERWTCVNDYNYGLGPAWGQPSDNVDVLCARSNGNLALDVGVGGLQEWNGGNYWSINPQYNTFGLEEDTLGRLWSGNWGKLFLYDDEGGYVTFDTANSPMFDAPVKSLVADKVNPGFVWAATGIGVAHTDGVTWNVYPREMIGLWQNTIGHFIGYAEPAGDGTLWLGTGLGLYHFDTVTQEYVVYTPANSSLPSDDIANIEVTPDGSVWVTTFDMDYPYPGGLTRFDGETWQTWTMTDSPLPHNQVWVLTSRATSTGYEVWVGTASEGIAVVSIETALPGDLDGDGVVGVNDFLILLGAWGPCGDCGNCAADLDGDCTVGVTDFLILLANWD